MYEAKTYTVEWSNLETDIEKITVVTADNRVQAQTVARKEYGKAFKMKSIENGKNDEKLARYPEVDYISSYAYLSVCVWQEEKRAVGDVISIVTAKHYTNVFINTLWNAEYKDGYISGFLKAKIPGLVKWKY